jgi:hypothetical protein
VRARIAALATFAIAGGLGSAAIAAEGSRPSLSGTWQSEVPILPQQVRASPPPFKPEAAAKAAAVAASATVPDYCTPLKFAGYNYGVGADLEIRETPDEVTLVARDVGLVRHIRLDGRRAPDNPASSGVSSGSWRAGVLEVMTTQLDPDAPFPLPARGGPVFGPGAVVVERISMERPDRLVIDVETTAPAILTAPDRRRFVYVRVPPTKTSDRMFCADQDRSVDRQTGLQMFDMTPPADLPPPPAD